MSAGPEITVRRMEPGDIAQVLKVERACFADPWSAEVFSATLLLPYAYYYVAEIRDEKGDPRVIGECGVRDIMGEGEITNVAVLPDYRGLGIARTMFGQLMKESLQRGMTSFTLEVRAGNVPAIALYKRYGFHTEGVRKRFYEKPVEDALIMWRREEQADQ